MLAQRYGVFGPMCLNRVNVQVQEVEGMSALSVHLVHKLDDSNLEQLP